MSGMLRGCLLLLALCVPSYARAATPTPEGIAYMQELLGFDNLIDQVFHKQFDEREPFKSLPREKMTCLGDALRAEMRGAVGKSMSEMFVDQQTVAEWMRFSLTTGGGKFLGFFRDTVVATVSGETPPDLASVMAALPAVEQLEVVAFMESPAAKVLQNKFPEMSLPGDAALERQIERCGIALPQAGVVQASGA